MISRLSYYTLRGVWYVLLTFLLDKEKKSVTLENLESAGSQGASQSRSQPASKRRGNGRIVLKCRG